MPDDPHAGSTVLQSGAPLEDAAACVILLHGRGATAASILDLGAALTMPGVAFLAPQAATVGYAPMWYPHSFLAPLSANEPWLSSALRLVGDTVRRASEAGLGAERVVVAGFSQGACLALEYVARDARRYGGLVALSGGLIGSGERPGVDPPADKLFEYEGDLEGTPVFLGCSDRDPHIPVARVRDTDEVLRGLGGDVDLRIYEGMGHTVNQDELDAFRALVEGASA